MEGGRVNYRKLEIIVVNIDFAQLYPGDFLLSLLLLVVDDVVTVVVKKCCCRMVVVVCEAVQLAALFCCVDWMGLPEKGAIWVEARLPVPRCCVAVCLNR